MRSTFGGAVIALAFAAVAGTAQAQSAADFYKNNRLTIVVGTPAGGGYDLNARTLARYLTRHISGGPNIIVQNMPGANSMNAANHVYNIAAKDGTVIGAASRTMAYAPLFEVAGARYDVSKLHWIGSTAGETAVSLSWHTAPVKTAADLFTRELIIGATDPGGDLYLFPYVFNKVLGTKFKIVPGYASLPPIGLALERGEIEGVGNYTYTTLLAGHPDWIRDNKVNVLMQLGLAKHLDMPDIPLVMDFAKTNEQKQIVGVFMSMKKYGFPFFVSPEVPADRVKLLQTAFAETMRDPEFQTEQKQQQREVSPSSGDEIAETVRQVYGLPPDMIAKLRSLMPQ